MEQSRLADVRHGQHHGPGRAFLLEAAVKKRDLPLAEWLLARGANPNAAPARDKRFPKHSLYELALTERLPEMAELLGAPWRVAFGHPHLIRDRERFY